jgi:hypothetical protein
LACYDERAAGGECSLRVCASKMAERVHKYAEVHSLDARSNTEKDAMLRSQQDELSRLRAQLTGPGR